MNPVKKSKAAPAIKTIQTPSNSELEKVSKEVKVYTEKDHLVGKGDETIELYQLYKQAIQNPAHDIELEAKKLYIAFKKSKNIADIVVLKNNLKIFINMKSGELDDPKRLMRDVSSVGHWGNGDYEIVVADTKNLEYIMSLVKQVI